jgi:hypothetical protein
MCGVACPGSGDRRWLHLPRTSARGLDLDESNETVSVLADSPATTVVTRRDRDAAVDPQSARIAKWRDENSPQTFGAALPLSLPIP